MSTKLGNLKRKRRQPEAKKIKKHSDYVNQYSPRVQVGGPREKTDTGYRIEGFSGKSFETYFENMLAGTSGSVLKHEKKDKTVRVLSGILFVSKNDGKITSQIKAIPGDEIILERGTSYRLSTGNEPASFFVCQNAKYSATLEVVVDTTVIGTVSEELLKEPSPEERLRRSLPHTVGTSRKGSKAKEQLAAVRAARERSRPVQAEKQAEAVSHATYGTNPRPGMGNFSAEGAG